MIITEIIKQKDGRYQIGFSHSTTEKERNAFEDFMGRFVVKEKIEKMLTTSFSVRQKLEKEFIIWAKKHNAKICPMNVISWYNSKLMLEIIKK